MRNAAFSGKVAKDVSRQHALTVQKNSRNCVMAHQKTAKIVVKTELESPHQKIQKAEWIAKIAVTVTQRLRVQIRRLGKLFGRYHRIMINRLS